MGAQNKHRQGKKKRNPAPMEDDAGKALDDPRFAGVRSDPRFGKVSKHKSKVAIDSRFSGLLDDKRFASSSAKLDKRGKLKKKDSRNPLDRLYRLEQEEEEAKESEEGEEETEEAEEESGILEKIDEVSESDEESEKESGEDSESEADEESGSTTEEEVDGADVVYDDGEPELQEDVPEIEKETRRLAIVNMDWRHVKAVDLYVLLSSFLPKDGQILSVAVYPSDFGLQRMKEEEVHGPIGLFDDEENDDGSADEIDDEKLRAYEKLRMRYYYAVVECDSSATADYLYRSCDGTEFERSANVLDLRFIPDSMEFKHPPRDVATEAPTNYAGLDFHSNALQQSKVQLSWDEDEPGRLKKLKRNLNDEQLAELELKEFLASDESQSEEEENENAREDVSGKKNKKIEMYRSLLESGGGSEGEDEEEGQDMEVTFNTGLEDISKHILEKKDKKSETVWEAYLRKKREKKKARKNRSKNSSEDESSDIDQEAREEPDDFFVEEPSVKKRKKEGKQKDKTEAEEASRAELELLVADEKGAYMGLKGYSLKPKKAKGKKGKAAPEEDKIPAANLHDPRFSVLYTSPLFAVDPTDPQFKRSAEYARQVAQRQQKERDRKSDKGSTKVKVQQAEQPLFDGFGNLTDTHKESDDLLVKKKDHELSTLVRSVKMKSKQTEIPSSGKMSRKSHKLPSLDSEGQVEKHGLSELVQSVKRKTKLLRK